jgi:hypothetical protein
MKILMKLLTPFILEMIAKKSMGSSSKKTLANVMGFLLLASAYILGCIGLYHYLVPLWGVAFSLFGIGLTILTTSILFFLTGWICKKDKSALTKPARLMESALPETVSSRLPIAALVAVGALAFYFALSKNKED